MISKHDSQVVITSRANAVFKRLFSLQTSKGIRENGVFLAGGEKIAEEILRDNRQSVIALIRTPDMPPGRAGAEEIIFSKERFRDLNLLGTSGPLLELRLPAMALFNAAAPWPEGCSLFIPFGDPENIGAVIRSAAGLGVGRVVLLREAACPFLPRAVRASAGALLRMRLESGPGLSEIAALSAKIPFYALDMGGRPLTNIIWPPVFGLVAGMEGAGLPAGIKAKAAPVSIPLEKGVDSLNAAAAVAIALWDWKAKNVPPASDRNIQR
ncbi:MAG: RNA methyltransferase [Kiritimatiellae bacterium]|nr:RNA methyltransferase [Kiritimatiellia bacterium]